MRVEGRQLECLARDVEHHERRWLGSIRVATVVIYPARQQGLIDDVVSDLLHEAIWIRPAWRIHLTLRFDDNALTIPNTECPHPASPAP
jgi:hypothetical protein